ncbi:Crp/Fnr family transcriptional regulator [Aurantibacter sp.]|uniref:Crp/Fnr family transcriptional regulator n=1 Tax=Aurantibacter sp. TaxID=2807103 RepID=UPI0035C79D77
MLEQLVSHYSYLFETDLLKEISYVSQYKTIPEGEVLMDFGQTISYMPLVLEGALKISREDKKGDELVLYFIEQGDTCAMTLSCCIGNSKSEIKAITETDTTLVLIPVNYMELWLSKYKSWQRFIIQSYNERMNELLEAIDTIAFLKMDQRLFKYLKDKAMVNHNNVIFVTHQDIAQDLHTSRVVVSRLLKVLEIEGKIKLQRNQIKLLDF